jgi:hypothetical protein
MKSWPKLILGVVAAAAALGTFIELLTEYAEAQKKHNLACLHAGGINVLSQQYGNLCVRADSIIGFE